jgi:hypothetical protein
MALTSLTSGSRSVGIVHLQAKALEFVLFCYWLGIIERKYKMREYLKLRSIEWEFQCVLTFLHNLIHLLNLNFLHFDSMLMSISHLALVIEY